MELSKAKQKEADQVEALAEQTREAGNDPKPGQKTVHPGEALPKDIKAGDTIEFGGGAKARIVHLGARFMQCNMVGKKGVTSESIGGIFNLGDQAWRVISSGRVFRLEKV